VDRTRPRTASLPLGHWIAACAAAETLGMTAAAAAARLGDGASNPMGALALIVAGGLIEGVALGSLQALVLSRWLQGFRARLWIVTTTVMAGLGWAAASAPSQFDEGSGAAPGAGWVLGGAALLGAALGGLLGAGQMLVLRGRVPHPARWVGVSMIAWAPAMLVIFFGATLPDSSWALPGVVVTAALTGAVAGALLGAISGILSAWLTGTSATNQVILELLGSSVARRLGGSLVGLRLHGRRTGRVIELPVQYATDGDELVLYPSKPGRKNWWRNVLADRDLDVLLGGRWRSARGVVVMAGDPRWALGHAIYARRWPRVRVEADSPLVIVELSRSK
jgi:hypothetical protein